MLSRHLKFALCALSVAAIEVPMAADVEARERTARQSMPRMPRPPSKPVARIPEANYRPPIRPGRTTVIRDGQELTRASQPHGCARNRGACNPIGPTSASPPTSISQPPMPPVNSEPRLNPLVGQRSPYSPTTPYYGANNGLLPPGEQGASRRLPPTFNPQSTPDRSLGQEAIPDDDRIRFCADRLRLGRSSLPLRIDLPTAYDDFAETEVPAGTCGIVWTGNQSRALGALWFEVEYRDELYWASSYYLIAEPE